MRLVHCLKTPLVVNDRLKASRTPRQPQGRVCLDRTAYPQETQWLPFAESIGTCDPQSLSFSYNLAR